MNKKYSSSLLSLLSSKFSGKFRLLFMVLFVRLRMWRVLKKHGLVVQIRIGIRQRTGVEVRFQ